jgi:hypothetical protein
MTCAVLCSVNTRVGNELGAGNADAARLSVCTAVVVVALVQCLLMVACKLTDRGLVGLLTNNQQVKDLTLATLPILLPTFISKCSILHTLVSGWYCTRAALSHIAWIVHAGVHTACSVACVANAKQVVACGLVQRQMLLARLACTGCTFGTTW